MSEKISLELLFNKLSEEKKTGELLPLSVSFYLEAEKHKEASKTNEDTNTEKQTQNFIKTLDALKTKRTQKILIYLAYNKNLPKPIPIEEEELYIKIKKILNKENSEKTTKIKIHADVPEIITTKGQKLGPYKQNEIVEMNNVFDIEFITNNKIGEIID